MLTFPYWLATEPRWLALVPLAFVLVLALIEPWLRDPAAPLSHDE